MVQIGIFACFALAGIALILTGGAASRIVGLALIAMFGIGGLAWWLGEFRPGSAAPPRLGRVRLPDGIETSALVLPVRARKVRTGIVTMAAFGAGALIFALSPERLGDRDNPIVRILMLAVGVFLGTFAVRGLTGWRRGESYLALTPQSLALRAATGGFAIPWAQIVRMRLYSMYGQPHLGIKVGDARSIQAEGIIDSIARFERPLTGDHRSIWLGGFSAPAEVVAEAIRRYFESPDERLTLGRAPIPESLRRASVSNARGISLEEKRHARSLGRWPAALLLTGFGIFWWAVAIRVVENVSADSDAARSAAAVAVTVALTVLLVGAGLTHFGAAVAVARSRAVGRKVGLALSVMGVAIGLVGAAAVLATGAERAWAPVALLVIGYSISFAALSLLGDLEQLRDPAPATRALENRSLAQR